MMLEDRIYIYVCVQMESSVRPKGCCYTKVGWLKGVRLRSTSIG